MKSFVLTLRAVGTEFAMGLLLPVVIGAAGLNVALVLGALWLTTVSTWWWLLFIPIVVFFSVCAAVSFVAFSLIRYVRPAQTATQQEAVKQFVGKLQTIAEVAATPKLFILFRVTRSIAAPSKDSYLSNLVQNRKLASEFRELQRSFQSIDMLE